mgnify:CR=1 FL=1
MKYIDRKGNITIEENGQDKFLRHLYNDWGGRLCLKIIIQPFGYQTGWLVFKHQAFCEDDSWICGAQSH